MLWGYHVEIERSDHDYYAHKTGFTLQSLINFVAPIGFPVHATRQENLEITAVFFKQPPGDDLQRLLNLKRAT